MALAMRSSVSAVAGTKPCNRGFLGTRVCRATNGCKVVMRAGSWLPGADAPSYLTDDIPGNFGFDPLGLAKTPDSLQRFQEAELVHCRWAMLGVAGALFVEAAGITTWYDAPLWAVTGGKASWFGVEVPFDLNTLAVVEFVAFAVSESARGGEPDAEKRKYPGGAFDPLGFAKDSASLETYKLKEIKNGRLAMLAALGFFAQYSATGKAPLAALGDHLASPFYANFATNGTSLPFL